VLPRPCTRGSPSPRSTRSASGSRRPPGPRRSGEGHRRAADRHVGRNGRRAVSRTRGRRCECDLDGAIGACSQRRNAVRCTPRERAGRDPRERSRDRHPDPEAPALPVLCSVRFCVAWSCRSPGCRRRASGVTFRAAAAAAPANSTAPASTNPSCAYCHRSPGSALRHSSRLPRPWPGCS